MTDKTLWAQGPTGVGDFKHPTFAPSPYREHSRDCLMLTWDFIKKFQAPIFATNPVILVESLIAEANPEYSKEVIQDVVYRKCYLSPQAYSRKPGWYQGSWFERWRREPCHPNGTGCQFELSDCLGWLTYLPLKPSLPEPLRYQLLQAIPKTDISIRYLYQLIHPIFQDEFFSFNLCFRNLQFDAPLNGYGTVFDISLSDLYNPKRCNVIWKPTDNPQFLFEFYVHLKISLAELIQIAKVEFPHVGCMLERIGPAVARDEHGHVKQCFEEMMRDYEPRFTYRPHPDSLGTFFLVKEEELNLVTYLTLALTVPISIAISIARSIFVFEYPRGSTWH